MRHGWLVITLAGLALAGCTTETGGGGAGGAPAACTIPESCTAPERACLGLVDNTGKTTFGLRVAEVGIEAPSALSQGMLGRAFTTFVRADDRACGLSGTGTFSWLMRFDLEAGTLTTGGAAPPADPAQGYRFVEGLVGGERVEPATFPITVGADLGFHSTAPRDLTLPIYLDEQGTVLLFPVRAARFASGKLSASHGCIGSWEPAALDPANGCLPDETARGFVFGGAVEALLVLEDADRVVVPASGATLCATLAAGDASAVEETRGVTVCRRDDAGHIVFRGDACSVEGSACGDAVAVRADFAASSVAIVE